MMEAFTLDELEVPSEAHRVLSVKLVKQMLGRRGVRLDQSLRRYLDSEAAKAFIDSGRFRVFARRLLTETILEVLD